MLLSREDNYNKMAEPASLIPFLRIIICFHKPKMNCTACVFCSTDEPVACQARNKLKCAVECFVNDICGSFLFDGKKYVTNQSGSYGYDTTYFRHDIPN